MAFCRLFLYDQDVSRSFWKIYKKYMKHMKTYRGTALENIMENCG